MADSLSLRHFAGLSLEARVPDETTLCQFRDLRATHSLGTRICALIPQPLAGLGFRLRQGTVVDATLMDAPTSTQNQSRQRDPEMHSTRKGQPWSCDMKLHIEIDPHVTPRIPRMRPRGGVLSGRQRSAHRVRAHHRARVEHPFRVLKGIFGFRKVRYRGWHQNTQRGFVPCTLANLYWVRSWWVPTGEREVAQRVRVAGTPGAVRQRQGHRILAQGDCILIP